MTARDRLARVSQAFEAGAAGHLDFLAAARQALREDDVAHRMLEEIPVPPGMEDDIERCAGDFSLGYRRNATGGALINALEWAPAWLCRPTFQFNDRRVAGQAGLRGVDAQPCVRPDAIWRLATNFDSYLSLEHRGAARSVAAMKPGEVLMVCLPTGGGKSNVGLVRSLARVGSGGTTLMIVPTVSLALDQERQYKLLKPNEKRHCLAYHASLKEHQKQALRERVNTGEQRVLFTSPESITDGVLGTIITELVQGGRLDTIVIDEAHMVLQWGLGFRPSFHEIATFRKQWIAQAPEGMAPRTVLLSATITQHDYAFLARLFGDGDDIPVVGANSLRPELEFALYRADDREAKLSRVREALRHLPRPAIVFFTIPEDAISFDRDLRDDGYRRVRVVHGGTNADERATVVASVMDGDTDIVVATSAFGLGVDIPSIRTVIHACMPETIARYFQEVGRAGRDGRGAVGILVSCPEDERVAKSMQAKILKGELESRMTRLWESRRRQDGSFVLNMETQQLGAPDPYGGQTNENWNRQALLLMDLSDVIEILEHSIDGPLVRARPNAIAVGGEQLDWRLVRPLRDELAIASREGYNDMIKAVGDGIVCSRLSRVYKIRDSTSRPLCGGCADPVDHPRTDTQPRAFPPRHLTRALVPTEFYYYDHEDEQARNNLLPSLDDLIRRMPMGSIEILFDDPSIPTSPAFLNLEEEWLTSRDPAPFITEISSPPDCRFTDHRVMILTNVDDGQTLQRLVEQLEADLVIVSHNDFPQAGPLWRRIGN